MSGKDSRVQLADRYLDLETGEHFFQDGTPAPKGLVWTSEETLPPNSADRPTSKPVTLKNQARNGRKRDRLTSTKKT